MPTNPAPKLAPPRQTWRQFFISFGVSMFLLSGFILFQLIARQIPFGELYFAMVGAPVVVGTVLLIIGLLWHKPTVEEEKQAQKAREVGEGEMVLYSGVASYRRGWESVAGHLSLTSERLVFLPNGINFRNPEISIPLETIRAAKPCMTMYLIPNSIVVETLDRPYQFIVFGRGNWIKAIEQQIGG